MRQARYNRVPLNIRNRYGSLVRELRPILRDVFNRVTLPQLALQMNIEFDEGTTFRELSEMIINKTLLFVSLIEGRTNIGYSNAIMDIKPYKELLQYTTFS
jgi:hypothetical protein